MNTADNGRVLVNARLEQADNAWNAGQLLLEQGFYADAINRFYYSMFYAVLALLATRQLGTSKHQGAISLFDREFVKSGIFSKELSTWLHDIFEQRLEADYANLVEIQLEDVQASCSQAHAFIQQVKAYLKETERLE